MTQKPALPEAATVLASKKRTLRPAVAAKLEALLDRDDDVVIATTLAELVARHTTILFDPAEDQGCEGLGARATEAVRLALDESLTRLHVDRLPGPTRSGHQRLARQAASLVEAFQARGAVIEERKRREQLRNRIAEAVAALAEAVALDPDIVSLVSIRLDRILAAAAPLYAPAEFGDLAVRTRLAVGQAAADALMKKEPGRAADRLRAAPYPQLLGEEPSARLAELAARVAPAIGEDTLFVQLDAEACAALQSLAAALVPVLVVDGLDRLAAAAD